MGGHFGFMVRVDCNLTLTSPQAVWGRVEGFLDKREVFLCQTKMHAVKIKAIDKKMPIEIFYSHF